MSADDENSALALMETIAHDIKDVLIKAKSIPTISNQLRHIEDCITQIRDELLIRREILNEHSMMLAEISEILRNTSGGERLTRHLRQERWN